MRQKPYKPATLPSLKTAEEIAKQQAELARQENELNLCINIARSGACWNPDAKLKIPRKKKRS